MISQAACTAFGGAESPEPLMAEKLLLPTPDFLQKVLYFEWSPSHQTRDTVKKLLLERFSPFRSSGRGKAISCMAYLELDVLNFLGN